MSGTVHVWSNDHGHLIACHDVLYLPNCAVKLMPVTPFTKQGCRLLFDDSGVHLTTHDGKPILSGLVKNDLYYFNSSTVQFNSETNSPLASRLNAIK